MRNYLSHGLKWLTGIVTKVCGSNTYEVHYGTGNRKVHADQLKRKVRWEDSDDDVIIIRKDIPKVGPTTPKKKEKEVPNVVEETRKSTRVRVPTRQFEGGSLRKPPLNMSKPIAKKGDRLNTVRINQVFSPQSKVVTSLTRGGDHVITVIEKVLNNSKHKMVIMTNPIIPLINGSQKSLRSKLVNSVNSWRCNWSNSMMCGRGSFVMNSHTLNCKVHCMGELIADPSIGPNHLSGRAVTEPGTTSVNNMDSSHWGGVTASTGIRSKTRKMRMKMDMIYRRWTLRTSCDME